MYIMSGVPPTSTVPVASFEIAAWVATILGSLVLIILLGIIGARIPRFKKIDDVLRLVIAFFGITGVLVTLPFMQEVRDWILERITSGTAEAGGAGGWVTFATIVIAAIGAYVYYNKGGFGNLLLFVVTTLPLFVNQTLFQIMSWFTNTVALPVAQFVFGFFTG